jgi:hypothetical protein
MSEAICILDVQWNRFEIINNRGVFPNGQSNGDYLSRLEAAPTNKWMSLRSAPTRVDIVFPFKRTAFAVDDRAGLLCFGY